MRTAIYFHIALHRRLVILTIFFLNMAAARPINLAGVVQDILTGSPVQGAEVSLAANGLKDTTDDEGRFLLSGSSGVKSIQRPGDFRRPSYSGNTLSFLNEQKGTVTVEVFNLRGVRLAGGTITKTEAGFIRFNPGKLPPGIYCVRISRGCGSEFFKTFISAGGKGEIGFSQIITNDTEKGNENALAKSAVPTYTLGIDPAAVQDSLKVSKSGYLIISKPLDTLDHDALVLELGKTDEFEEGWAKAPQILAAITPPRFPDRDISVADYGADSGGSGNNYLAFKQAIEACHNAGGGRVVVPAGTYRLEGPVHLLSNVNLHLQKGSKLDFYWNRDGYLVGDNEHQGRVPVRWEGTWIYNFSPLIYAWEQKNIGLSGEGEIDGNSLMNDWPEHVDKEEKNLWGHIGVPIDERITNELTPGTIEFYFCENVLMEDFTSGEPNERNVHPVMCTNVTIRNLNILPSNSTQKEDDGIDPDACRFLVIEDCRIHSYDDNIGIKSGRDNDGWIKELEDPSDEWYQEIPGRPSSDIIIRRNWFHGGYHNMVGIGSDQASGAYDIFIWDCQAGQEVKQDNILSVKSNPNRGGEVHHIYVRDIQAKNCGTVLKVSHRYMSFFSDRGPYKLPRTHHIYMENITVENGGETAFIFDGWDMEPLHDFFLKDITVPSGKAASYNAVATNTITAENVMVNGTAYRP